VYLKWNGVSVMNKKVGVMMLDMARKMFENCEKDKDLREKKRLLHERVVLALKICY
jgi:hypothetical protein